MSHRTATHHLKVNEHTMQRALKKRLPAIHPCTLMLVVFLLCPVHRASAQIFSDVQINASPNPVGSGARAQGMGGAFIAVADDATAASWNPGGLIQLERPEFSIVGSYAYRQRHVNSASNPEADGWNSVTREDLNYLSCALPFRAFDKNFVVSLNYQRLYDFYNKLSFDYDYRSTGNNGIFQNVTDKNRFQPVRGLEGVLPRPLPFSSPRACQSAQPSISGPTILAIITAGKMREKLPGKPLFFSRTASSANTDINRSPRKKIKILKRLI